LAIDTTASSSSYLPDLAKTAGDCGILYLACVLMMSVFMAMNSFIWINDELIPPVLDVTLNSIK